MAMAEEANKQTKRSEKFETVVEERSLFLGMIFSHGYIIDKFHQCVVGYNGFRLKNHFGFVLLPHVVH